MTLNLVKLCVGVAAVEELESSIDLRLGEKRRRGIAAEQIHTTRMIPKRIDELLDGGSLYWVIKGNIQCRQLLEDIRIFTDPQGIRRCQLVFEPRVVLTRWQPRRAFQGWRYLDSRDAPPDLGAGAGAASLPVSLRLELAELGLL